MQQLAIISSKVNLSKGNTKYNDPEVCNEIVKLWNTGLCVNQIARCLNLSKNHLTEFTRNWNRVFIDKRYINVFAAYCLITEHGFSKKEAARALDVHPVSLARALIREVNTIEKYYDQWKGAHTRWRKSLKAPMTSE